MDVLADEARTLAIVAKHVDSVMDAVAEAEKKGVVDPAVFLGVVGDEEFSIAVAPRAVLLQVFGSETRLRPVLEQLRRPAGAGAIWILIKASGITSSMRIHLAPLAA